MNSESLASRWEAIYRRGEQLNRYPSEEVVAWFSTHHAQATQRAQTAVLELGCGAGNNLLFLAQSGFRCAGIEISAAALQVAEARLREAGLHAELALGDFARLPFADSSFEVVLDRGALACVDFAGARQAIAEAWRVLRPGGRLLFTPLAEGTRLAAHKADLVGCLYTAAMVRELLASWQIQRWLRIERHDELDDREPRIQWWIEAAKPA